MIEIKEKQAVAYFGTGDICITPMEGENGEHRLGLINQSPREVGSTGDYVEGDVVDCNEFPILFEFTSHESIDALIKTLQDVRKQFFKPLPVKDVYTDDELRYAAYARCECGAGIAYPKGRDFRDVNCWDCSDILTGRALEKDPECKIVHTGPLPFAFYEIKSEDQPSVRGATTRPDLPK